MWARPASTGWSHLPEDAQALFSLNLELSQGASKSGQMPPAWLTLGARILPVPGRTPVGAPRHWDSLQHLCILFSYGCCPWLCRGWGQWALQSFSSAPREGIALVLLLGSVVILISGVAGVCSWRLKQDFHPSDGLWRWPCWELVLQWRTFHSLIQPPVFLPPSNSSGSSRASSRMPLGCLPSRLAVGQGWMPPLSCSGLLWLLHGWVVALWQGDDTAPKCSPAPHLSAEEGACCFLPALTRIDQASAVWETELYLHSLSHPH